MGYRGKLFEQARARELRAQSWRIADIAEELGVAESSVSLWVREVDFEPQPRRRTAARRRKPNVLARRKRKQDESDRLREEGRRRMGNLSEREFLVAGVALYAGEGGKTDGAVRLANTNPVMLGFFCAWLRHFFAIEETRLRVRMYLHHGFGPRRCRRLPVARDRHPAGAVHQALPGGGRRKHPAGQARPRLRDR